VVTADFIGGNNPRGQHFHMPKKTHKSLFSTDEEINTDKPPQESASAKAAPEPEADEPEAETSKVPAVSRGGGLLVSNTLLAPALMLVVFGLLMFFRYYVYDRVAAGGVEAGSDNSYLNMIVAQLFIYVIPALLYLRIKGRGAFTRLRVRLMPIRAIPFCIAAFFVMLFGSLLVRTLLFYLVPGTILNEANSVQTYSQSANGLLIILAAAVMPALCEEFVFRGIVVSEYERNGALTAVIFSSLFYACAHFVQGDFASYVFAGVILAVAVIMTNSVMTAVILHLAWSLGTLATDGVFYHVLQASQSVTLFMFLLAVFTAGSLFFMFYTQENFYIWRAYLGAPAPMAERPKNYVYAAVTAILSPTFLLFAGIYAAYIIVQMRT